MTLQRLIPPAPFLASHVSSCAFKHDLIKPLVPLFDTLNVRQIEAQALAQVPSDEPSLMQRAGHSLYRLICARYPHAQHIWVVAGAGNNGGDALVAATWLKHAGRHVYITWLGSDKRMSADIAQAIKAAQQAGLNLAPDQPGQMATPIAPIDLIVDGLLGIGLNVQKPLAAEVIELIVMINANAAPVVAVDLPSGLLTDTGAIYSHAVKAECTLTFLCAKPGLFTADGRAHCGEVWLDTLKIKPHICSPVAYLFTSQVRQATHSAQTRAHNTHKGSFGDVAVVGGATGMVGAALLAARASIYAGAGRVYIALLTDEGAPTVDMAHPELMFKSLEDIAVQESTVVCGCGGGAVVEVVLPPLLEACPRLVLDADALNTIAANDKLQRQLQLRKQKGFATVITPHPLEAARLLETTAQQVQNNRLEHAQALANRFACTCVLKGSGSITASLGQRPIINSSGNAALATAGTGDVLAGWLAGRWSAAASQCYDDNALHQLIAQCAWEHGDAADRWLRAGSAGQAGVLSANQLLGWL